MKFKKATIVLRVAARLLGVWILFNITGFAICMWGLGYSLPTSMWISDGLATFLFVVYCIYLIKFRKY